MASFLPPSDEIVCHCLRISESEVRTAMDTAQANSLRGIMKATDAGTGCTVCHCRIRQVIAEHQARLVQQAETLV
jgi:bacterioferritin-associated ferredoxin